jgi:hypothetical protein
MKSNEVGTTLKHPETINGNVKNLSKRMKMKDKGECHFYFKNLTLPLITTLSCTPKHLTTPTSYLGFRETSPLESPRPEDVGNASPASPTLGDASPWNTENISKMINQDDQMTVQKKELDKVVANKEEEICRLENHNKNLLT